MASEAATVCGAVAYETRAVVLPRTWRVLAGFLKVFGRGSLLVMAAALATSEYIPSNALAQMRIFIVLFLAPEAAAWSIARAFAARVRIGPGVLVIEQPERRIEVATSAIAAVEMWRVPLPAAGFALRLASGDRISDGLSLDDIGAFIAALAAAGAAPKLVATGDRTRIAYADARHEHRHRVFDHPILKFIIFPLIPALPAFRLHQIIAYGGTLGEYYTYGLRAYLIAFAIWWGSWAIGLTLFAAVVRGGTEIATLVTCWLRPAATGPARRVFEILGRVLFYLGVPAWLLLRLWAW